MRAFDCIVLGVGGVGSAALYHLARRGIKTLGIERFAPPHDQGSSHGVTRIIRQAYYEHSDYVPLLKRAYELWEELEEQSSQSLLRRVGLLEIGPSDGEVIPGVLASARLHGLRVEQLSAREIGERFPGFYAEEGTQGVFEPGAGYLRVEDCVRAHVMLAQKAGAEILAGEAVRSWEILPRGVRVTTDRDTFESAALVITAGAWSPGLLAELGIPFQVLRKTLHWLEDSQGAYHQDRSTPCFLHELPQGVFYGLPAIDREGVKVAEHSGGIEVADPNSVDRSFDPRDETRVHEYVAKWLPRLSNKRTRYATCLYTMTPDKHFIVDRHPGAAHVCFAAGLSGHGFKFTSALGEALAEMAIGGRTGLPIGFLGAGRFSNSRGQGTVEG